MPFNIDEPPMHCRQEDWDVHDTHNIGHSMHYLCMMREVLIVEYVILAYIVLEQVSMHL